MAVDEPLKVLVAIVSYGTGNDTYLRRLIDEYREMSYRVDVVVFSNLNKREAAEGAELVVVEGLGADPCELPFAHKALFSSRREEYDLFIYSEDDVLVSEDNIRAFLEISGALPSNEIAGFIRFEADSDGTLSYPDIHGHYYWVPSSVRTRGEYTLAFFTNEHAACYILTREQLDLAIDSGGFLVPPHCDKYDLVCTAGTDPYTQCGFEKVVCISHLDRFLLHHLPNKYLGTTFGVSGEEVHRQVAALLSLSREGSPITRLLETETSLPNGWYSKQYYEPVQSSAIDAIPTGARSILSIGCGSGATEASLRSKGYTVTAVPLDSLISKGVELQGIEVITGDFDSVFRQLGTRRFDCVLVSNILHLVSDPTGLLFCCATHLNPAGVCIATIPNTGRISTAWKAFLSPGRPRRWQHAWRRLRRSNASESFRPAPGGHSSAPQQKSDRQVDGNGVMQPHLTSRRTIQGWFRSAGLRLNTLSNVVRPAQGKVNAVTLGLAERLLASEFIAVAKREAGAVEDIDMPTVLPLSYDANECSESDPNPAAKHR